MKHLLDPVDILPTSYNLDDGRDVDTGEEQEEALEEPDDFTGSTTDDR